ncbi:hypothetical protein AMS68_005620 [Peltaster fructicola]|uniref:SAP domain-containing protein n=1 Tax=Peltaster fructicola TaxID=286661 RepID=A0A6H0XZC0_9PEZI|nr:hypothetical protein AMS68_005620 [Peltaster fructicola]
MPTPIDRAMDSRNLFMGFAALVTGVAAWTIWGGDMFPQAEDPKGEPEKWTDEEMRRWLRSRNLLPTGKETRAELLTRIKANLRAPRT